MTEPQTPADLIDLWPTIGKLADALGEKYPTVAAWKQRNSIPQDRWLDLCNAAERDGLDVVSVTTLLRVHARPKAEAA